MSKRINSRSKGQRGEREIVKILQEVADEIYKRHGLEPPLIERNQNQTNKGGYDLNGLDDIIAPEVKLCQTFQLDKWWGQAVRQAHNNEPVLFYRKNRHPWRVRLVEVLKVGGTQELPVLIDISIDDFKSWLAIRINQQLKNE